MVGRKQAVSPIFSHVAPQTLFWMKKHVFFFNRWLENKDITRAWEIISEQSGINFGTNQMTHIVLAHCCTFPAHWAF